MLKIIILILIVIICSFMGYIYGEGYKRRYSELMELKRVLIDIENEIVYSYSSLPDTILSVGIKSTEPLKSLFINMGNRLNDGIRGGVYEAMETSIDELKEELCLSKDDLSILLDLSKSLGETDIYGQEQIFKYAKEKINRALGEADIECKKNVKIYRALGLGFGTMLAIFLM